MYIGFLSWEKKRPKTPIFTHKRDEKHLCHFYVGISPWGDGGYFFICHWMGSHFHDWVDYNEVPFSMELLE